MWLFTKSGFFSAVRHSAKPDTIHVRSRFAGDLERLCQVARSDRLLQRVDLLVRDDAPQIGRAHV